MPRGAHAGFQPGPDPVWFTLQPPRCDAVASRSLSPSGSGRGERRARSPDAVERPGEVQIRASHPAGSLSIVRGPLGTASRSFRSLHSLAVVILQLTVPVAEIPQPASP